MFKNNAVTNPIEADSVTATSLHANEQLSENFDAVVLQNVRPQSAELGLWRSSSQLDGQMKVQEVTARKKTNILTIKNYLK